MILKRLCKEPEGEFEREVRLVDLSIEWLKMVYEKLKETKTFEDIVSDPDSFILSFVNIADDGEVTSNGYIFQIDDVGYVSFENVKKQGGADFHAAFWDRRFRGREPLVRELVKHFIKAFDLSVVFTDIPLYAVPALAAIERVGFKEIRRNKKQVEWRGQVWDTKTFYADLETLNALDLQTNRR